MILLQLPTAFRKISTQVAALQRARIGHPSKMSPRIKKLMPKKCFRKISLTVAPIQAPTALLRKSYFSNLRPSKSLQMS
jgi:hypothetical protein